MRVFFFFFEKNFNLFFYTSEPLMSLIFKKIIRILFNSFEVDNIRLVILEMYFCSFNK
jgi:hypothetical protein